MVPNQPHARLKMPSPTLFLDGIGFWFRRRAVPRCRRRASRLRRACKRIGLKPSPLHTDRHGAVLEVHGSGFTVSCGPAWDSPRELADLLTLASSMGARVTRLDLALDFLGEPAMLSRWALFPSVDGPGVDHNADALRLKAHARRRRPPGWRSPWTHYKNCAYMGGRRSARGLTVYSDKPSKLAPDGPPVLHAELRLRGGHLPAEQRDPVDLIQLVVPETRDHELAALLAQHCAGPVLDHLITRAGAGAVVTSLSLPSL